VADGPVEPTAVSAMTYSKFGPRMKNYNYVGMWAGPPKYDGKFNVEDYTHGPGAIRQEGDIELRDFMGGQYRQ